MSAAAELMDEAEAARRLGVSKRWLVEQRRAGRIKYAKLSRPKYRQDWLDQFIEASACNDCGSSESSGSQTGPTPPTSIGRGTTRRLVKFDMPR